jgi:glycosyltransferase involved in cell wall biosynthesis
MRRRLDTKPTVAFFLLRSRDESAQLTGGTLSNLALITSLSRHDALVVVNAADVLAEELSRRGIRHVVIEERELSWAHARKDLRTLARRLYKALRFNVKVGVLCAREGVSVLQCDEAAAMFVGPGARLSGARLVVAYRNHPGVVPRMKAFYKLPTLFADRLVATSELLREAVASQGWRRAAHRIQRIYNGIDLEALRAGLAGRDRAAERASLGIAEGEVAIGVIGSIVPFKLQAELLGEVMAAHADRFREVKARFHFLGGVKDEAYAARCRALVEELGLGDITAWRGYIADMTPWLFALDLVAFPAPEGTARTLLEAAAFGIPAVARETSREAVVHGESGFLCAEVKDLAEPLLRLCGDAELRAEMGARGRLLADERFDIAKNRERYAEIYDTLVRP